MYICSELLVEGLGNAQPCIVTHPGNLLQKMCKELLFSEDQIATVKVAPASYAQFKGPEPLV